MSGLGEASVLIGQRAADLEKAREVFTAEIRNFATGVLAGVRRVRQAPWVTPRLRIDVPREIGRRVPPRSPPLSGPIPQG